MNTTTFDINKIDAEKLKSPATWNQCGGLSKKFARKADKMDWRLQKQINSCLYGFAKDGKLSFGDAHKMFSLKKLPKKYSDAISAYLADNLEA